MLLDSEIALDVPITDRDSFDVFNETYARHRPTEDEYRSYGRYAVTNTLILQTPTAVLERGEVLTNPSIIEGDFAYFRQEPTSLHLGKTKSVPYRLLRNRRNDIYLSEFSEASVLTGEDPRVMRNIKIAGPTGKVYNGWCVSTVVARPNPNNPADVQDIRQVFYWGENLGKMEPILEIPDLKNTNIFPLADITGNESDTRLDVFGRPHPHITHIQVPGLMDITNELIQSGENITEDFLPPNAHVGVNNVKSVPGHPNLRELDIHEAYAPITSEGKTLHYRLGRYGYNLSTGRLTALGVIASRSDFPQSDPKPPENGVKDYTDVLYGSLGNPGSGIMVTGVSDRHVGLAQVVRIG